MLIRRLSITVISLSLFVSAIVFADIASDMDEDGLTANEAALKAQQEQQTPEQIAIALLEHGETLTTVSSALIAINLEPQAIATILFTPAISDVYDITLVTVAESLLASTPSQEVSVVVSALVVLPDSTPLNVAEAVLLAPSIVNPESQIGNVKEGIAVGLLSTGESLTVVANVLLTTDSTAGDVAQIFFDNEESTQIVVDDESVAEALLGTIDNVDVIVGALVDAGSEPAAAADAVLTSANTLGLTITNGVAVAPVPPNTFINEDDVSPS